MHNTLYLKGFIVLFLKKIYNLFFYLMQPSNAYNNNNNNIGINNSIMMMNSGSFVSFIK